MNYGSTRYANYFESCDGGGGRRGPGRGHSQGALDRDSGLKGKEFLVGKGISCQMVFEGVTGSYGVQISKLIQRTV